MSRAAREVHKRRVELAPIKPVQGTWITPVRRDPLDVPPEEKKTVVESPPREEPREGKEGGEPECVRDKRPPECTGDR
jgi:hypothetical protein